MPIDLSLSRITKLLANLGNPQKKSFKSLHIAGTNGKGSTIAYISSILTEAKIRNGRFTSPHLLELNDCIAINGEIYPMQKFLKVNDIVKYENEKSSLQCTEFELLTATAFKIFDLENVELALVEVGVGGRLDATNCLQPGLPKLTPGGVIISAITKIGLDHQSLLGETLEAIAKEKAGIIKPGVPVVIDKSNRDQVIRTIINKANVESSPIFMASLDIESRARTYFKVSPLRGAHQLENLTTTLTIVEQLRHLRYDISEDAIQRGISNTKWAARLQTTRIDSLNLDVLVDGAHNEMGAANLRQHLSEINPQQSWVIVFGISQGKNIEKILSSLATERDLVIPMEFSTPTGMPWVKCASREEICRVASDLRIQILNDKCISAPELLKSLADLNDDKKVVVCGSLYLCADFLRFLRCLTNTDQANDYASQASKKYN